MTSPGQESYGRFADVYDAAYAFVDYKSGAAYVQGVINRECPGARTLLEVACGTGLYLQEFAGAYHVEGLDRSRQMLAKARVRLPGVPLHEGDMRAFDLGRAYDVVCCLFRSIAYVRTPAYLQGTIAAMAHHLAPGGVLLVEPFFTPETYWVNRVTLNQCARDDSKLAWMYVSERTQTGARLKIHCLVGTPAGVEHFVEVHEMGLFTPDDFQAAFAGAGLRLEYDPVGPGGLGLYTGVR